MKFTKWKIAGVAALASVFAFTSTSANAGAAHSLDGDGVDYDAACVVSTAVTPPGPNSIGSPGAGCSGVTTYDGSTQATDLQNTTQTNVCPGVPIPQTTGAALGMASVPPVTTGPPPAFCGNWNVGQTSLPAPGNTTTPPPDGTGATLDTPNSLFGGVQYFTMYQNKNVQTNVPTNPVGGCPRVGGGQVFDQHGAWQDGFHFWISYGIHWDGNNWVHSVKVGEYDPSPTGGFFFTELGYNDGSGWQNSGIMAYGTNWGVTVTPHANGTQVVAWADGIVQTSSSTCATGIFKTVYGTPGDVIANGKALTTADQVLVLPVAVPLSNLCGPSGGVVCEDDLRSIGGFIFFSDVTGGNSSAGAANTNITGIAYTGGAVGVSDTLGAGPTCPTPTFGGTVPPNPLLQTHQACHIDDDSTSRGSFLSEWWDTPLGFTF